MTKQPLLGRQFLDADLSPLPEKVIQFGSGRFLRAFADYFVDEANRKGLFGGRVLVVQSTGRSRAAALEAQGGLFTLWVRGACEEKERVIASISRALVANDDWPKILQCARSAALEVVLSNTTEVGLVLDQADELRAPRSFPGKLTAFLYERARHFDYSPEGGLIVLPCELVASNGEALCRLVLSMARQWRLEERFLEWTANANTFCNTLVDRIVPGFPLEEEHAALEARLGYRDAMLTVTEPYRLWAIEGDASLREQLGFSSADPGIVITQDIEPYRLRKVRILNGGHTLSVPLGFLMGNHTVRDNMTHPLTGKYIEDLLREEIGPTLAVEPATIPPYIDDVLNRWRNPHLHHQLIDITLHSTSKLRHRVIPSLVAYYAAPKNAVPHRIALGFAAYLLFMRGVAEEDGVIYGECGGARYPIRDTQAAYLRNLWPPSDSADIDGFVAHIGADESLWGADLTQLPGFTDAVGHYLQAMMRDGVAAALADSS